MPSVGDPFQLVFASLLEDEAAACNEVLHRLRHEHLRGTGEGTHPGTDHDAQTRDVIALERDLARVQSRPDLDTEGTDRVGDRSRAEDPTCRPVERHEETIPSS